MTRSKKNTAGKPTTATQLSPMMTVAEVAELLGFGQNFVYRLVSKPGFPAVKVGNSYRIFREGLMEWLDAQKVNNTPEVLHNMWDPEVAPYPAGGKLENTIIDMKKEIKMSFLKDVFQTADEIKQSREKFKDAVDVSNRQAEALIRPYLSEAQNEILSEILEGLVTSVAEHSFQIGYNSAMQTFAEAAAAIEAKSHAQQ
ncbi:MULTISPECIES: helix-turn-helix domain-containing protein [Faecalibacterium]|jgi:excisionase family DNA binding protein|uniref:helix-turn-helix domain-containing protein n=1 Tax=Faecalibacterium TaxID=216851 RepID=UPI001FAB1041|nr:MULTISPECIES: helix-turn-helix domain-containing protein [Faecalibacterium]